MCVELWDTVYSRPGVITLCNAAGFDTSVVGQHLVIEHAGAHARNFEYGYSCARSAAVAKDMAKGKDTSSASSTRRKRKVVQGGRIFYFEAQLVGGGLPLAGMPATTVPASLRAELCTDLLLPPVTYGELGAGIGIVKANTAEAFDVTNVPLESVCFLLLKLCD